MRRGRCRRRVLLQLLVVGVEDESDALLVVGGVGRVMFGHGVGWTEGFGLVDGAHVLGQRVGAGEGAVAFCQTSSVFVQGGVVGWGK